MSARGSVGDIGGHGVSLAAPLLDHSRQFFELLLISAGQNQPTLFARQLLGQRPADSARRPSHNDPRAIKIDSGEHGPFSFRVFQTTAENAERRREENPLPCFLCVSLRSLRLVSPSLPRGTKGALFFWFSDGGH